MDFDFELEDILNSVKENKEHPENKTPIEPPTPYARPLEPPKPRISEPEPQESEAPKKEKKRFAPDFGGVKDKVKAASEDIKKKNENNDKVKFSLKLPAPVKKAGESIASLAKKIPLKKAAMILGVVLLACLLVFGSVKLVNYGKTAYLHKYEKKYEITFPVGIQKDFCDDYGKDQTFAGTLQMEDTGTDLKVYGTAKDGCARLQKGSTVLEEQEVRSIALEKTQADLEAVYGTPDGFKQASQRVTFNTLFGEEVYRVVYAYYTNTKAEDDDGYLFPYSAYGNLTEKSFKGFEDRIRHRALYDTGFKMLYEHRILTLSVPSDFMPNFKFVVVCVKTKPFKKSSTATPNDSIHYPQVWYTKNNQKNPYFLSGKWYPEIITDDKGTVKKLTVQDFEF